MSIASQVCAFLKVSEAFLQQSDAGAMCDDWLSVEGAGNSHGHLCMSYAPHALTAIADDGYDAAR
jgi:hypothetical protein